jgi:hypothetical protein
MQKGCDSKGRIVAACVRVRAFEGHQQPLRLDDWQAEAVGELAARVRAGRQLTQVDDRVCALIREPFHGALEARRVRAEVERFE